MPADLEEIYDRLYAFCEAQGFAGHDPFDGLGSPLFRSTPLNRIRAARLAWLQIIKRSPFDLRGMLRVAKGVNPKALALFTLAELSRLRATADREHADNAHSLLERLLGSSIPGKTSDGRRTLAFGYNFDWQSRHFYAPLGTPAIVPTAFSARALIEAFEMLADDRYLAAADEICAFIVTGLNRVVDDDDEVCFSYTPVDRSAVYNASLLAGETLARIGAITGNGEYLSLAERAARFVIRRQRPDGSWPYGEAGSQQWVDNFHSAYVLMSLRTIANMSRPGFESPDPKMKDAIDQGYRYWRDHFFLADGTPKYYDDTVYPVDIHACAVAIIALCEFSDTAMAQATARWTIQNMLDEGDYFYYQVRKSRTIKTSFMRWSQAWMAYALARLIEATGPRAAGRRGSSAG